MSDLVAPTNDFETRVLALLDNEQAAASSWIKLLNEAQRAEVPEADREWPFLAQEALAKVGNVDGGVELLKWRAEHIPPEYMTGKDWIKAAEAVAGSNPLLRVLVQEAGFGQRLAARECVRRFRLLRSLQPGVLCLHPTWGFGVVRKADSLYKKIEIDFRGRPGHGLAMKVAAETIERLEDTHLLAQLHLDRDSVQQMVKEAPADVVRLALADFGSLPAAALQSKLIESDVVPENEWKRFWDAARKVLKADPMVAFPSKRTEPIRLLDRAAGYDDVWFDRLANERNLAAILEKVGEWLERPADTPAVTEDQRKILANRLAFVLLGATRQEPGLRLSAALLAERLKLDTADCDWPTAVSEFLRKGAIVPLLHDLPARDVKPALEFLWAQNPDGTRTALLSHLRHLHFGVLQEAMDLLLQKNCGEDCRQIFADACATHLIREEMLLWIMRNPTWREAWDLPLPAILAALVVEELEQDYMGDRLKTQKLLREKFEDTEWLQLVFDGMTPGRQEDFFRRLNQSPAWPGLDRQVIQAKVIKLYPHLQSVVAGDDEPGTPVTYGAATSHRTYRERQEKLEKLINIDIPANSKEIAVARSYGDLSENFEYKAAKDMQRVLMARRAELETMMSRVRPTDFSEAQQGVAGMGSTVLLEYPDGHLERFHILGEWDQQPERNIISSNTRLAKALAGKKAGDRIKVPSEDGGESECVLKAVETLSPEIVEWAK
ncbi:MAG: GreA/GreB family elongation factor [Kiritimatiellia bacterium]|jgi:transcription elongation GreA/GreB family factor|nr:GreA/GreB family elongation factor [Kiritimatiellia bacterium]